MLQFIGDDVFVEQLALSMVIGLFVLDAGIFGAVMFAWWMMVHVRV